MMKKVNCYASGKVMPVLFTAFILLTISDISAQQQSSAFSIPGWTPGSAPVFSGSNSNVISLSYGDSMTTAVAFSGMPNDGLGADEDNMASMSFSYSYTVYLTQIGDSFSVSTSIPIGTHTISAYQSCSSGTVPPWSIGYDAQPAIDTNSINMNISDEIKDCIPQGNYQVDIVFNTYAQNSVGPNVQAIELAWLGYTNSNTNSTLTTLTPPSTANTNQVVIGPVTSYMLGQVAFIQISRPASCPSPVLHLPGSIQTNAAVSSATVTAWYPGYCQQDPCTYLWSDGETTPTATNLSHGTYTVTVTTPCGTTATASVTISDLPRPMDMTAELLASDARYAEQNVNYNINTTAYTGRRSHEDRTGIDAQLPLYPNPAVHNISLGFTTESNTTYSIRIMDILGNEVMVPASNVSAMAGEQKIDINLDQLQAGVYMYELSADKTYRGKFVKQ